MSVIGTRVRRRAERLWLAALLPLLTLATEAQETEAWRAMNRPFEPFRIADHLYYVGASDITAFLIATPAGHILIDGGFPETAPMIRESISRLGFDVADVEVLLNSHAHGDHAGGLAALKRASGARLVASRLDAPLLERGGTDDDVFGDAFSYPAVQVDRRIDDGDTVELGGVTLTARITPGHTRGCTSWVIPVRIRGRTRTAVSICSLTLLPRARLHDPPSYPGIVDDFPLAFARLRAIEADLFLASHGQFFDLGAKRDRLLEQRRRSTGADSEHPFIDPEGYRSYIRNSESRFLARRDHVTAALTPIACDAHR